MAVVESQSCNWEASGWARRSLVCFWSDFRAAWKIAWKREELEAAVVACIWDMMDRDGGGTMKLCGGGNED